MLRHLAECSACRDAVLHLEQTIGVFRTTAVEYSALTLASRPKQAAPVIPGRAPLVSLRWAFAGLVPLLLLVLALLPVHVTPAPVHPTAPISDDALLDQVDEQLSVAVPSSMESLTHLVSADNENASASGDPPRVCGDQPLISSIRAGGSNTARRFSAVGLLWVALGTLGALAQQPGTPPQNSHGYDMGGPPPMEGRRPPMERALHLGPHGRWWNNPDFVKKLGLTEDQQKKMETIFEQNRPSLIDLSGGVRKEEMAMDGLLGVDTPEESKILAQIDRVAQARAELEKANARMLLGLRRVLTPEQYKTLQASEPKRDFGGRHPYFGPMGQPGDDPGPAH